MISVTVKWTGADRMRDGFAAAEETLRKTGVGLSYYRPRPALPEETVKPARAWLILGAIQKRTNRNPLDPPRELENDILEMLHEEVGEAIEVAFNQNRPQRSRVRAAVLGGAKELREDAQYRIRHNATGFRNSERYARIKGIMMATPASRRRSPRYKHITREFGGRPLPLVLTGRLYHSMTERWYETEPRTPR